MRPRRGSAHCMLAPIWAERLGKTTPEAVQVGPVADARAWSWRAAACF